MEEEEKARTPSPPALDENLVLGADAAQPKDPRSKAKYNLLSRLLFLWVDPLFFLGCRRDLKQSDLYAHPQEADSSKLGKKFDQYWGQELSRKYVNKKPRLWMVFAKSFKWPFLLQFIMSVLEVAMFVAQSVILGELVDYFTTVRGEQFEVCVNEERGLNNSTIATNASTVDAYLYSLGLFLLAFGVAMVHAHYGLIGNTLGMMSRIMSTSAVYNKLLRLSQVTITKITDGHIINVVSNDVQRLDLAYTFLPFLLIAPIHMAVFTYLAYLEVGWVVFITLVLFILQIPGQLVLAKIYIKFRFKSAAVTDERVLVMNEVITGARVVKMYAWEHAFKRAVTALRKHEIHFIKIGGLVRTLISSFSFAVSLTLYMSITFIIFVGAGGELTPRRVIVTLSLLGFLRTVSASFLIRGIFLLFEARVALTRIQAILELEEIDSSKIPASVEIPKNALKGLKRIPDLPSESPYLPGTRKVVQNDDPVQLTAINPLSDGVQENGEELYPIPPAGQPAELPISPSDLSPSISSVSPTGTSPPGGRETPAVRVKVSNLTATWKEKDKKTETAGEGGPSEEIKLVDSAVLKNVSIEVSKEKDNSFLAVVGKVASGKSTLLQCLMAELEPLEGTVEVDGKVSYASQIPWVFYGTIRENILFGLEYKDRRYQAVIDACALREDLKNMPDNDQTVVGERGVILSGGQKARVNLARAVYRDADIYLLDDPLSAVDAAVGKQIFNDCIQCFLKSKVVILVTHQVQFAMSADQLLILNKGEVEGYHSQAKCQELGIDQHKLLEMLKDKGSEFVYDDINDEEEEDEVDGEDTDEEMEEEEATDIVWPIKGPPSALMRFTSAPSQTASLPPRLTMSVPHKKAAPALPRLASISEQRSYQYILSREDLTRSVENMVSSPLARGHFAVTKRQESFSLGGTIMEQQDYADNVSVKSATINKQKDENEAAKGHEEEKAHGTVSMKTYFKFFMAGSNVVMLLITTILFILGEALIVLSDTWISIWSSCAPDTPFNDACGLNSEPICKLTDRERLGTYGAITLVCIVSNVIRTILFYLVCLSASRVLHNRMFAAIIRVPMRFFDINPSGRILNRFSKDIGFLDDLLPHTFLEYLFLLLKFFAVLVTAAYSNQYILIPAFFIVIGFIALRWYYLKTSRDVKRLEAIARSPLYSHVTTTLHGLSTIRTLNMQQKACDMLHSYQNQHTQGWYLYLVTQRWFGMRIDIVTALYLGVVAIISVPLARSLDSGVIGLALAYTIALAGILQFCVRQSAEVENIMISAERILEYSQLEPEASLETDSKREPLSKDWPAEGGINFNNVKFKYAEKCPYTLKNFTLTIKPHEKIGIVGRTGAGKSTLISVLFRLAEPEGELLIDGVEIKSIGLHDLRKNMSIIPQDPVLFSGNVRYNLDPLQQYPDDRLWEVLEQVQLKEAVQEMEGQLSGKVAEGGSNFSVGQKQLVCLARALLNDNKILILDEATANVDIGTDSIIQKTIKEQFSHCTVLTIAHRLNTIMDSDKILVMSQGQKAEFDTPFNLLQNRTSLFSKMVDKTGPEASRVLRSLVKAPSS